MAEVYQEPSRGGEEKTKEQRHRPKICDWRKKLGLQQNRLQSQGNVPWLDPVVSMSGHGESVFSILGRILVESHVLRL